MTDIDLDYQTKILSNALDFLGLEVKLDSTSGWTKTGWKYAGWKFFFKDKGVPAFLQTVGFSSLWEDWNIASKIRFPSKCPLARLQCMLSSEIISIKRGKLSKEHEEPTSIPFFVPYGREKHNPFFGCKSIEEIAVKLDLLGYDMNV